MMLMLFLLVGSAFATLPDACKEGEYEANGRFTGQNIDMNYEDSALLTSGEDEDKATSLRVQFYVPRRYTDQYEANAFAITFNRNLDTAFPSAGSFNDKVTVVVDEGTSDQSACYSNRYDNYTFCETGGDDLWTIEQNADNDCMSDAYAVVPWVDVLGDAFHGVEVHDNGGFTEVFLTATVETWTHFVEGNSSGYLGVMTGREEWLNTDLDDGELNKQGTYGGDGGWKGVGDQHSGDFGNIVMDDERYTLYQIPFILRFPKTVVVETSFRVASPITVLTGVIAQDVITLDLNPTAGSGVFAVLEAVLTTSVQYPYAVRSPDDDVAPMTVVVGDDEEGTGTHAASVEFIEFDQESSCGGVTGGELCTQTFKIRITPADATPCTVAGDYFFEFWAECQNGGEGGTNGCTLDDLVTETGNLENQRESNAYFSEAITINHQPFCPLLVDEVRVVGDFRVFHDEAFITQIAEDDVFTNDILFYEAEYRTASQKGTNFDGFDDNDFDSATVGTDSAIDYVRATKIFMDVTLGQTSGGDATGNWDGSNWDDNMDFAGDGANPLGGTRIPGSDITGDDITVTQGSGDAAKYQIVLCNTDAKPAAEIEFTDAKPADCFTNPRSIAVQYLDFSKMTMSKENLNGDDNEIDENEVAFAMRMDERIIPLKPLATDGSFVTVTIESEVYYKGNRHASRRLLQAGRGGGNQRQNHSMSTSYKVYRSDMLSKCNVGEDMREGHLELELSYEDRSAMPSASNSLDFANRFGMQLERYLGARDAVSVARMEQCNEHACQTMYYAGRKTKRRLEGDATYVKVDLKITSNSQFSAGHTMNKLQDQLVNQRSDIYSRVSAFEQAEVTSMEVPGCGEDEHERNIPLSDDRSIYSEDIKQESSAAAFSAVLASLVALWALL